MTTAPARFIVLAVCASMLAAPAIVHAASVQFSASGADPVAIQSTVDAYRAALGDPNNMNNPGPLPDGRREINWDGGGLAVTQSGTPFNGFLNTRGAQFTTPGTGFVQAPETGPLGGLDTVFNPTYATIFQPFSQERLFSPIGSNITDVLFFIPGTNGGVPATVDGFGAVFTDVDLANVTSIQYFDEHGASLGSFSVPTADTGLSFLGVVFNAGERVARVRIVTGNTAPGPNDGGSVDVAVMDDFLYAEPQAVPEPSTALLLVSAVVALACRRRRPTPDADMPPAARR
jgi:hypothetical protein